MRTNLLSDEAFHATMMHPLTRRTSDDEDSDSVNIWRYIDAISEADFQGFRIGENDVQTVYQTGDLKYDHVLIPTETKNVFLVIVVDLNMDSVFGHHLLNLNDKYGLETPQ